MGKMLLSGKQFVRNQIFSSALPHIKNKLFIQLYILQHLFSLLFFSFPLIITEVLHHLCQQEVKQVILLMQALPVRFTESVLCSPGFALKMKSECQKE